MEAFTRNTLKTKLQGDAERAVAAYIAASAASGFHVPTCLEELYRTADYYTRKACKKFLYELEQDARAKQDADEARAMQVAREDRVRQDALVALFLQNAYNARALQDARAARAKQAADDARVARRLQAADDARVARRLQAADDARSAQIEKDHLFALSLR